MIRNIDNKNIQEFEYETKIISDGNIVGTCELGKAEIQLLNNTNTYNNLKGLWINTIHGSFYIYDIEPIQEKINIKLKCYDVKYRLDIKYDSSLYQFPMTLKEWRNKIGIFSGIVFDNADFPNSNLLLNKEPYIPENASNRNVISMIAQAGSSFVITDKNDIFYFKWFEETEYLIDDWLELTTESELTKPINVVVLGRGNVEDNVYYPEILPEEKIEFRIDNNYILDPQDTTIAEDRRYEVIAPIFNQVNGLSYLIFNMRTRDVKNKLSINLGEKINYKDIWGNDLMTYVMTKKIKYIGGDFSKDDNYEVTLSAEKIKETSTDFSYASNMKDDLNNVSMKVDKQNKKIEGLIEIQKEQEKLIEKLTIDQEGMTNILSSAGGNNVLRNTSLSNSETIKYDDNTTYQGYEFWLGQASKGSNYKAVNGITIIPKVSSYGNFRQILNASNLVHTLSFMYKKSNELATCSVKINDVEYSLANNDFVEFKQTFEVTTNQIVVEFITDIDNALEIYDLMLNVGNSKLAYSQNANEITTDTVKIGKGISIIQSNKDTEFRADADGTRVLNSSGETTTEYLDTGMRTKSAEIEDNTRMSGLFVKRVSRQTWINGLG